MARMNNTITRTVEVRTYNGYSMNLETMTVEKVTFEMVGIASTASAKQIDTLVKAIYPNVVKYEYADSRYDLVEIPEVELYEYAKEHGQVSVGNGRPPMNK